MDARGTQKGSGSVGGGVEDEGWARGLGEVERLAQVTEEAAAAWSGGSRVIVTEPVAYVRETAADDGTPVAKLEGFCLRPITRAAIRALQDEDAMAIRPVLDADDGEFRTAPVPGIDPAAVLSYVRRRCAELSGHPAESIDADAGFVALGLDSIAAVRLANDLDRAFGRYVPAVRILAAASLRALAEAITAVEPTHGRPVLREARPADPR